MVDHRPAPKSQAADRAATLLANLLVLGVLAFAWALELRDPEFFYRTVQEDGTVEWVSFWAFFLASGTWALAAWRQRRSTGQLPWFLGGVALFCLFVAMEEISWGQRLLGFQPPAYFLEHNYQQEANLHNVIATDLRMLVFSAVIAGYGIALPLLALAPPVARLLRGLAVVGPPAGLIPIFAVSLVVYEIYPWDFAGEIVELMVGLGFLFAALMRAHEFRDATSPAVRRPATAAVALAGALALGLGLANDALSRRQRSADPAAVEEARLELEALARDVDAHGRDRRVRRAIHCGVHKRLYGLSVASDGAFLADGEFLALVERGLPEQRAEFLIDPWSTAYWLRYKCADAEGRRSLFLYSFGPNRLRDSDEWELGGDDVGVYLVGPPEPAPR
ncbi:MAG: hypothetical protein GY937_07800 [bacterium]|nr:hypothetical protein [bacterium]